METRVRHVGTLGVTLPLWAWLVLASALAILYSVTFDSGFLSARVADSAMYLHEFFHDGRHLLGVPCH